MLVTDNVCEGIRGGGWLKLPRRTTVGIAGVTSYPSKRTTLIVSSKSYLNPPDLTFRNYSPSNIRKTH
jgi:hypothetical protein